MKKIGLISDTHSSLDIRILEFFRDVDEIWHAGDIGSMEVVYLLQSLKPLRAVYGNIDDTSIRGHFNEIELFKCESLNVLMIHIGGYPGRYEPKVKKIFKSNPVGLFISGHSHILKVMYDKVLGIMHINPGAAGMSGFHHKRTALKFDVENQDIRNLKILEIDRS